MNKSQVKSKERVANHGEVYTSSREVNAMLDLVKQETERIDSRFLEPACGTGNFLAEIFNRKLSVVNSRYKKNQIEYEKYSIIAVSSLYGIDILEDNVIDCRNRLFNIFIEQYNSLFNELIKDECKNAIFYLLSKNIIWGDALTLRTVGEKPSPIVFSEWSAVNSNKIKRRDFIMEHLVNTYALIDPEPNLFSDMGDNVAIPKAVKEFTPIHFLRLPELETHAYQFIHRENLEEIFNMKFDVIIGNPPYQLDTGGSGRQAKPIYNLFIEQAKKLNPRYLIMIIPSRWFAGGMGLDSFRDTMLKDKRIKAIVDFSNAKDCFQGISISGGVNYFLWEKDYNGPCSFTNIHDNKNNTKERYLDEFPVLVRYNEAVDIIHKVNTKREESLSSIVSSINPFGFATSERGANKNFNNSITLYSSKGIGYVKKSDVTQGLELLNKYKVMVSQTISEHAGEPDKRGQFKLLSTVKVLNPGEICTFSYIAVGAFDTMSQSENLKKYLETKFVRFLILQAISSIHITKEKFIFVPLQDFAKEWNDEILYQKYKLNQEEIDFIESKIKPME